MISENLQLDHASASVFTGDGSARIALFTEHLAEIRPLLLAYLVTRTGGDPNAASDCLQEVAVVLWKKHDSNWNAEDFRRYAFRCADIEARSYHRKCRRLSKRIVFLAPDVVQALGNETQEQIDADPVPVRGRIEALRQCLDGLDPVQRQLLDARYEKDGVGKSVADIAREKGCKMETLYKRLERIRTSLHNCISKRLKDLPA